VNVAERVLVGAAILLLGLFCLSWAFFALFFLGGWQNYVWETDCREGHPFFAIAQAAVCAAGIATGVYAVVKRRPNAFKLTAVCFVAWFVVLIAYPEQRNLPFTECT
jgi:hypothetical protein